MPKRLNILCKNSMLYPALLWVGLSLLLPASSMAKEPVQVVSYAAATDIGHGREKNEDYFYIAENRLALKKSHGFLAIVADGMGGHAAGEVASRLATETVTQLYDKPPADEKDQPMALAQWVKRAHDAVVAHAQKHPENAGMGTTLSTLLVRDGVAYLAHVGDTRILLFREGKLIQLSQDHTVVQQLVRQGKMSPQQALKHPKRNILFQAIGLNPLRTIQVSRIALRVGDKILLCSDGLHDAVTSAEIAVLLGEQKSASGAAEILKQHALEQGSRDNVSVVVLYM